MFKHVSKNLSLFALISSLFFMQTTSINAALHHDLNIDYELILSDINDYFDLHIVDTTEEESIQTAIDLCIYDITSNDLQSFVDFFNIFKTNPGYAFLLQRIIHPILIHAIAQTAVDAVELLLREAVDNNIQLPEAIRDSIETNQNLAFLVKLYRPL